MVRLPRFGRNERNTTVQPSADEGRSEASPDSAGLGRKLAVAIGIGALAYLLVRRRDREDSSLEQQLADPFGSDESEGDGLESAQKITIDDPSSESDRDEDTDDSVESVSTTDRSAAEIDERAETDAQEEPAEPGEMTIDEDVAAEVVDDETNETDGLEEHDESRTDGDDAAGTDTATGDDDATDADDTDE